ncbi:Hsp70 family protein [Tenggerimyces flavus]|uniref:Hsp70 family protein n=1 Tax=Tenggerimyces flavus TaxID=1708749 RepID=A0ABV7YPS0_9ACTN|nr:Hsp70 family protein [Tenggerimyces flavus]MBM7784483.1 molecular chaperone DnaK [Tenggerimyces flavus]
MEMRRAVRGGGLAVGIDLGTTFSAVARVNALGKPELIPNRECEKLTPSVVYFAGETPVVGTMAKRSVQASPLDVVEFVKRSMGDPSWRFETEAGTQYRPEEISALILKRLKVDAERVLGDEVTDAVITVPAYFDDAPRRATIDAGTIAGLNVRRILNEPTAAALAYGLDGSVSGNVVVYDLGGGTFDVTVLTIAGGDFRVLATHGDRNLGGFDFDNELMRLLNARFMAAGGPDLLDDPAWEAALREKAELAKRTLSSSPSTQVTVAAGTFTTTLPVTRAEFEDLCSALVSRTRDSVEQVVEEAGLPWRQVDRILLAGGSTRMPMVRQMLEQLAGHPPDWSQNPDDLIAQGAAIQAHLLDQEANPAAGIRISNPRPKIRDVTSHGLGQLVRDGRTKELINSVIVPRNTALPAAGDDVTGTLRDFQETVRVRITQGDSTVPEEVRIIADRRFPIRRRPENSPLKVTLRYDVDQVIYTTVTDLTSETEIGTFEIHSADAMDLSQREELSAKMRAIDP